jgi:large subunit ribosomal protein L10
MNRTEKVQTVEQLTERFGRSPIAIVTDYRGLNVAQITELRRKVREADGEFLISKNTLTRIAIAETDAAAITEWLSGPVGVAYGFGDAVGIAKAVDSFAKENDALEVKGGVLDGEALDAGRIKQLALMPGKDELRAKLLALLMTPATQLVRVLSAPAQQMVQVLHARSQQEEG